MEERHQWNETLNNMREEKRKKSADEKERKAQREAAFEQKQKELKGLAESKAARQAAIEKETQIKIVADLILHEKKYQEKMQKREEAVKQKQDVANQITTKAAEGGNYKREEQKR